MSRNNGKIWGSTFGGLLCYYFDNESVVRIQGISGAPFKCKIDGVYDDFIIVVLENGIEFAMPFTGIFSVRDVTNVPSYEWREHGTAEENL